MEIIKKIPAWFVIAVLFILMVLACFAVADGRRVEFWPPVIFEKNVDEISTLKQSLQTKNDHLAPAEVIKLFPLQTRQASIALTQQETQRLLNAYQLKQQKSDKNLQAMQEKLNEVERVHGTFLYKLLVFNHDAQCYGSSLNFTAGKDKDQCLSKQKLAQQFLEFLAEVDFYKNDQLNNVVTAKQQLLKLQDKYQFNTKGWYGPDVFKSIINEFHGKS